MMELKRVPHLYRDGEYVVLGKEDGSRDDVAYFTRRGNEAGQFSGHYNMSLQQAGKDLTKRMRE